jgi:hypothetical protein
MEIDLDGIQMSQGVLRRSLLFAPVALAAASHIRRELFLASPLQGTAVMASAFYVRSRGGDMLSIEQRWSRSDTIDIAYLRRSHDYGRTWTPAAELRTGERRPDGMLRRHPRGGFVDPTGRYIEFWMEGLLASDDPLAGLRNWNIYYRISRDGAQTFSPRQQVIHVGSEFNERHPLPGIWTGKNCVMLGDMTCQPISMPDGGILLPAQTTPLGPDGKLFNPGGGYTYTDVTVLRGSWRGDAIEWETAEPVRGDPARSTRGMDEATLAWLTGDRLLMVMRGSNDRKPELPSYRWFSISTDGGRRWSPPEPWTYQNGQSFFSPSACSQLVTHSSGRLFWLGNITPENPHGNRPRYPFVIVEVDRASGLLKRDSLRTVDTLQPGEDPLLTLSNFYAREDRRTREIVIHMTRLLAKPDGWSGDAYLYRVAV